MNCQRRFLSPRGFPGGTPIRWWLGVMFAVGMVGCAPSAPQCVGGATQLCYCIGGAAGVQSCNGAGTFDSCQCRGADGGTAPQPDSGAIGPAPDAGVASDGGGEPDICVTWPDGSGMCCATATEYAAVNRECPSTYTVDCGNGVRCLTHSTCLADNLCACVTGYLPYHCDGTPRPCTDLDPCTEAEGVFCAPCADGIVIDPLGDLGPLCTAMLNDVLPAINAELDRRRATEGSVVPPAIDLSECPTEPPPFDSFIGRYCDGSFEFAGQLDAQVAAALGACWLQQCGRATGRDEVEAYVADALATYHALWEDNCVGASHCQFYGTEPGCGPCSASTNCPNVTHNLVVP